MAELDHSGVVRKFYASLAARDWAGAEECFASDALWHLPGTSSIAGDHRGWQAIRDLLTSLGPRSGNTFKAILLDVAVGERYVVAVQHATADHSGRSLDITGCQLIDVQDGRIREMRGHYSDEAALNAFWL